MSQKLRSFIFRLDFIKFSNSRTYSSSYNQITLIIKAITIRGSDSPSRSGPFIFPFLIFLSNLFRDKRGYHLFGRLPSPNSWYGTKKRFQLINVYELGLRAWGFPNLIQDRAHLFLNSIWTNIEGHQLFLQSLLPTRIKVPDHLTHVVLPTFYLGVKAKSPDLCLGLHTLPG